MTSLPKIALAITCLIVVILSAVAGAGERKPIISVSDLNSLSIAKTASQDSSKRVKRLLSDHPGSATALTNTQRSEIRAFVRTAKGNKNLVCTGLSLARQRESMYRVVRLRAQLVCDYAKSLEPSLTTTIKEKTTQKRNQNGRVTVSSR